MESRLTFSAGQWELVLGVLVVTLFALVAGFVYTLSTRSEVGPRYRPAVTASSLVMIVATVSYIVLTTLWLIGYDRQPNGSYLPGNGIRFDNGLRYMDWTVSVPLLTIELVAISTLAGAKALKARTVLVASAIAMIVTGFLGEGVFGDTGRNHGQLWLWGAISTVPFIVAYLAVFGVCKQSAAESQPDVAKSFRNVGMLFALTWGVYPLAYMVPIFFENSSGWAVGRQVSLSVATIVAKVGFGVLVHKIGKMRTAYDIADGIESHDEETWLSSVKIADARPAVGVYLQSRGLVDGRAPAEVNLTDRASTRTTV